MVFIFDGSAWGMAVGVFLKEHFAVVYRASAGFSGD
jgi:hypothetical protein